MPFLAEKHVDIPSQDIVSWTFDHVSYDQDKPIYMDASDPSRSISARQARRIVRQLAAGFRAIGLRPGDCVCLHTLNDLFCPMVFHGVLAAGGVFAATNTAYKSFELAHHFKTAKVKFVLAAPEYVDHVLQAADKCGMPKSRVIMFDTFNQAVPDGYIKWSDLFTHGEEDWVRFDDQKTCEETTAARLFSSGTTGLPKAVMLSHKNFIAQHTLVFEYRANPWVANRLLPLPLFHVATAPSGYCNPLRTGSSTYIVQQFDLETYLSCVEKYKITDLALVPPIVIAVIMSPLRHKYSLKGVRAAASGAAPLDPHPQSRIQELLAPEATFTQVWGMTETCCISSMFKYGETDDTGSVGYFLPNMDVKLCDDDGKDITGYGVRGELCVRGPLVTKGYFENDEANKRDWDDEGYFHTGDIAFCDEKTKKWYIVDRKKELIKVRGFQVAPPELEGVLLSHPDIVDCAVIGVKFARDESEFPRAYVVRKPGSETKLKEEDVKKFLAERLVYYKRLDGGVAFMDAIPKTASGKILKRLLREQATKEIGAKL
ncbi:hypothetical protein MBLNU459_g7450t1 [Dothideomycetes sp. NU459]